MKYEIFKETGVRIINSEINQTIKRFAKIFKIDKNKNISIAFVSQDLIKKLNYQYRKINKITDVLSFGERDVEKDCVAGDGFFGEIVICYDYALLQAKKKKRAVKDEINQLLVHGLLHLIGCDHQTGEDEQEMMKKEKSVLRDRFFEWQT